jgi:dihydroxy-acid dehydratase
MGVELSLDDWDRLGRGVPTLVDLMPSGRFLMEHFFAAGGLPPLLRMLCEAGLMDGSALTVTGATQIQNVAGEEVFDAEVIRPLDRSLTPEGGIAVLRGNLAPRGAVLKPSAASPHLMRHEGPAFVFDTIEDYHARINDEDLPVDENSVLVLRNCGPLGYPGMPEVANMGLPPKLLRRGITDMVRVSDARMSGTAYGTVVLHAAPEAAAGGPLALIRTGDRIALDVAERRIEVAIDLAEMERRRSAWTLPDLGREGYARLFGVHVLQADEGCDFDFLVGPRTAGVPRVFI